MRLHPNPDGTLTLQGVDWSEILTPADLPDRLKLYTRLRDRGSKKPGTPGPWAAHYTETVTALQSAIAAQGQTAKGPR